MNPQIGQTYTLSGKIQTGQAPGQPKWTLESGQQVKILNQRTVGGQLYYDVQHIGGGTGWTPASALTSAIQQQQAPTPTQPSTNYQNITDINKYLNDYGQNLYKEATKIPTREEIKAEVTPTTPKPEVPNYLQLFEKAREEKGVAGLEQQLTELKGQQDEIIAERRQRITTQRGVTADVSTGVVEGRISKVEQQEGERLDTVQRAITRLTDQLNTVYSGINQIMQLNQMTYEAAKDSWNTEFNQNMAIYGLVSEARKEVKEEIRYQQQVASANFQTITNILQTNGLSYDRLSPEQQTQLVGLAVRAGLPPTVVQLIKPQEKMLFHDTDTGQVVYQGPNGPYVVKIPGYERPTKDGLTDTQKRSSLSSAAKVLKEIDEQYRTKGSKAVKLEFEEQYGGDKRLSLPEYQEAVRQLMTNLGVDAQTADNFLTQQMQALGYSKWRW